MVRGTCPWRPARAWGSAQRWWGMPSCRWSCPTCRWVLGLHVVGAFGHRLRVAGVLSARHMRHPFGSASQGHLSRGLPRCRTPQRPPSLCSLAPAARQRRRPKRCAPPPHPAGQHPEERQPRGLALPRGSHLCVWVHPGGAPGGDAGAAGAQRAGLPAVGAEGRQPLGEEHHRLDHRCARGCRRLQQCRSGWRGGVGGGGVALELAGAWERASASRA